MARNILVFIWLAVLSLGFVFFHAEKSKAPAAHGVGTLARVMKAGVLRCGYAPYPPYFEMDLKTGEAKGLMADIMTIVARRMNVKLEWTYETGWSSLTEDLKAGRFDAVCSAVWAVPARGTQASFSIPILYAPVYAYARSNDTRFDENLDALNEKNLRVVTQDGDANGAVANDMFPQAQKVELTQNAVISELILNVTTNKADIVFLEPRVAADFLKANPGSIKRVNQGKVLISYPQALVLPQGDPDFKVAVDSALGQVVYTGMLDRLLAQAGFKDGDVLRPKLPY